MRVTLHTRTYAHTSTHYDACLLATWCIKAKGLPCARTELVSNLIPSFYKHRIQLKSKVRGSEQESCGVLRRPAASERGSGTAAPSVNLLWCPHSNRDCKSLESTIADTPVSDTDRINLQ